jgi:hypothetical protein
VVSKVDNYGEEIRAMRSVPTTKLRVTLLLLLDVRSEPLRSIGVKGIVAPKIMRRR